jgi:hypothetical protein
VCVSNLQWTERLVCTLGQVLLVRSISTCTSMFEGLVGGHGTAALHVHVHTSVGSINKSKIIAYRISIIFKKSFVLLWYTQV